MNTAHQQFQIVFDELHNFSVSDKIVFMERLLFQLTIAGRAVWSDNESSDNEKIEAFKWFNELSHRIWNIRFDLLQHRNDDGIIRLYENMKYYGEQSNLLRSHLIPVTLSAFDSFKHNKQ